MKIQIRHALQRARLLLCLFSLTLCCADALAVTREISVKETIEFGNDTLSRSYSFDTNTITDNFGAKLDFKTNGTLKIMEYYSRAYTTLYTHLFTQTTFETGKSEGDCNYMYDDLELNDGNLSRTLTYNLNETNGDLVLYFCSAYGLSSTGSISSTTALNGVKFSWIPEGWDGDIDEEPDDDPWPDYVKLETNKYYENLQDSPVRLKFKPNQQGTLTVIQYGAPMMFHLLSDPAEFEADEATSLVACEYTPSSDFEYYTLTYNLSAGKTYYFNSEYGVEVNNSVHKDSNINAVIFSWSRDNAIPEIPEKQTTQIVQNKVYSFTPSQAGILTIKSKQQLQSLSSLAKYILYYNSLCTNPVATLSEDYIVEEKCYAYRFEVNSKSTYYVKPQLYDTSDENPFEVYFEVSDELEVSLKSVEPIPGQVFDDYSYASGVIINIDPAVATIQGARFTYTPVDADEPVTVEISCMKEGDSNSYYANIWEYYMNAEYGTDTYITLVGVEYNGTPLTKNGLSGNDAVKVDNGTVEIHYPRPDVKFEAEEIVFPTLYNYYEPSNPAGILDITFTENVKSVGEAYLVFGTHSYGSEGGEDSDPTFVIPTSVKENILTLDFTGIEFSKMDISNYSTATLMIYNIVSVSGQSYPGGASPLEVVLDFTNTPYSDEVAPDYMDEVAFIVSPAEVEKPKTLNEIVIGWGREIDLVQKNATVEVQIVTEVSHQAPLSINEDGNLVVDVSNWSTSEGAPVMGEYKINIPGGIVKNSDGEVNKAQSLSYVWKDTSTGIDGISVQEAAPIIYNLQGIRIMKDSVRDLPEGIYIVNGKKLVIN